MNRKKSFIFRNHCRVSVLRFGWVWNKDIFRPISLGKRFFFLFSRRVGILRKEARLENIEPAKSGDDANSMENKTRMVPQNKRRNVVSGHRKNTKKSAPSMCWLKSSCKKVTTSCNQISLWVRFVASCCACLFLCVGVWNIFLYVCSVSGGSIIFCVCLINFF